MAHCVRYFIAAHCVKNRTSFTLIFGSTDIDDPHYTVNITEKDIIIHPEYSGGRPYRNDIAVVEMKKMLKFGPKMDKIDMVDENYIPKTGDTVTM